MADGKRSNKAKGGHVAGSAPYGYRNVGVGKTAMLEEVASEHSVISEIMRMHAAGGSIPHIISTISHNMKSRSGKPFTSVQINRIIRRNQNAASSP